MSGGLGCCCCKCTQLAEFLSTQPGTIDGYEPLGNWSGNECCWFRSYAPEDPNIQYFCDECSSGSIPLYCWRTATQLEIYRGEQINLTLTRYRFGDGAFPDCDPDNNPETAFQGCKYFLRATYYDRAVLRVINYFVVPTVSSCPPPAFTCPQENNPPEGPFVTDCWGASVSWNRISKPFVNLPSSVTFDTQSVTTCYCNPVGGILPGCWAPCQAQRSVYDVEPQCVTLPAFSLNPCYLNFFSYLYGSEGPFGACVGKSSQHCFTPPTWTITF